LGQSGNFAFSRQIERNSQTEVSRKYDLRGRISQILGWEIKISAATAVENISKIRRDL